MNRRKALVSVSDKSGAADFARFLHEIGMEILSTGGTAKLLREANVPVSEIGWDTVFPVPTLSVGFCTLSLLPTPTTWTILWPGATRSGLA